MYVFFQSGGKHYRAQEGCVVFIEKLDAPIQEEVHLQGSGFDGEKLCSFSIKASIEDHKKNKKVLIFKKKRRHNYRRKKGHRQLQTKIRILSISPQAA